MHSKTVQEVLKELKTSSAGVSDEESQERLKQYGLNELKESKKISPWKIFFQQFNSIVIYILIAAVIISIFIGFTKRNGYLYD